MKRSLYPPDWEEISRRIRDRAGDRCEACGKENGRYIMTAPGGYWSYLEDGEWFDADGKPMPYRWEPDYQRDDASRVVLTCAHLDHDPTNNDPANLRAWCQYHHLNYDHALHMRHARATRMARKAVAPLPGFEAADTTLAFFARAGR